VKTGLLKNLLGTGLIVLMSATVLAQTAGTQTQSECRVREVLMIAKSTPGVHLNEKDEGRVIGSYKVLDCGTHVIIDEPSRVNVPSNQARPVVCPPNVQDCIAP
jgi:hypothetical protein